MDKFCIFAALKWVPRFAELEVETYFLSFEHAMAVGGFPKEKWTIALHAHSNIKIGKLLKTCLRNNVKIKNVVKRR